MSTARVAPTWKQKPQGKALQILPPPQPLHMPVQNLGRGSANRAGRGRSNDRDWRRTATIGATLAASAAAAAIMVRIVEPGGVSPAEAALLALFTALFAWVAFAFFSALAGFVRICLDRDLAPWRPQPIIFGKTALLLPTYNEDPGRILAAAQAMYEDLAEKGVAELYDLFILSDTRDGAIAEAEVTGVLRLRMRTSQQIFYRRRPRNTDRKAGNIADWVREFGAGYESMIVLDADSLMSADTIVRLTAAMEHDPKVGLIQTLPTIVGAGTLFARLQQFAGRVYGPPIAQGQAWWSGDEGNYWGHNAILRVRAFADCAGLPHIAGKGPFSGHIMSHDFVEAALLRRGGWAVRMAPALAGSFEETPPSLIDMAARDQRWCQGNLQHSAVLPAGGLHWVSRLHLARGILAYLTAPLWLAFLAVGGLVWVQQRDAGRTIGNTQAWMLFALTMALLLGPKIMGAALMIRSRAARRTCGGAARLALSVVCEVALSALIAPVLMLMQTRAVIEVLRGRHSGWEAQRRDEPRLSLSAAWRRHWLHTLMGLAWAPIAFLLDPALFFWTCSVTLGLALSIPISMLTSRSDLGAACSKAGLFVTPEEAETPAVMARASELRAQYAAEAPVRAQIERLFRAPVPMRTPAVQRPRVLVRSA
jgi:membrane glycosyltransferase